jgi:hypothetical protein
VTSAIWAGFAGAVVAAVAVALFVRSGGWLFLSPRSPHPTDAVLIERFAQRRAAFESLRVLFEADAIVARLTPDAEEEFAADPATYPVPRALIAPERRAKYRRLLAELEVTQIRGDAARDAIEWVSSSQGLMIGGSANGYVHLRRPPSQTVPDLSDYQPEGGSAGTGFRPHDGGWYVFVDVYRYGFHVSSIARTSSSSPELRLASGGRTGPAAWPWSRIIAFITDTSKPLRLPRSA